MAQRRAWPALVVALAIGFLAGSFAGILLLVGPGGFRPPTASSPSDRPTTATPAVSGQGQPLARAFASLAFDGVGGRLVMFGGLTKAGGEFNGTPTAETWTWDGRRWTQLRFDSGPAARWAAGVAYDPIHRVIVMRGGVGDNQRFIDETWAWDGGHWNLMNPTQSPPVFVGGDEPLVWNSATNAVELFAYTRYDYPSFDIPELNQVWRWDGANWAQIQTAGPPSGHGKMPAGIAFDVAHRQTVFFGYVDGTPTTWTLQGTTWTKVATVGPTSGAFVMSEDDPRADIVLLGKNGDTWTWDGVRWTARNPLHSPGRRTGESMTYDPLHRVVVLFGGENSDSGSYRFFNDTWTWDGKDWTQVA